MAGKARSRSTIVTQQQELHSDLFGKSKSASDWLTSAEKQPCVIAMNSCSPWGGLKPNGRGEATTAAIWA